jgi:hypothetical protein
VLAGHQWLTSVILANQQAEIRRVMGQSQPGQIVLETYLKRAGVARGVGSEFKPQYGKKKKKNQIFVSFIPHRVPGSSGTLQMWWDMNRYTGNLKTVECCTSLHYFIALKNGYFICA